MYRIYLDEILYAYMHKILAPIDKIWNSEIRMFIRFDKICRLTIIFFNGYRIKDFSGKEGYMTIDNIMWNMWVGIYEIEINISV